MATTNLTRTPATAGNRNKWTWSSWVKRSTTGSASAIFGVYYSSGAYQDNLYFQSSGKLDWFVWNNNAYAGRIITDALFRDVSAWYHIVCVYDNTLATATDRMKVYVNGVRETSLNNVTNPVQNSTLSNVNTTNPFKIGDDGNGNNDFDGSMAHVHFIDGLAYQASTFGETDSLTGIWKPITSPSVTYGTNGFFLNFSNSGSMGTDSSGEGNDFTVASGTLTQTQDTPANVFATLNALIPMRGTATYNNGNTYFSSSYGDWDSALSTIGVTQGKWYFETKWGNPEQLIIGCVDVEKDPEFLSAQGTVGFLGYQGGIGYLGEAGSPRVIGNTGNNLYTGLTSISSGNIVGCAIDLDNREMFVHINGTYTNSGNPETRANPYDMSTSINSGGTVLMGVSSRSGYPIETNFGNGYFGTTAVASAGTNASGIGIFEYDVPTGYTALSTKGLNL